MPIDAFLKVDGIPGESTDEKHKDWIEILSYSWGESQMASATASSSGGAATARADFQDFSVVKTLDKATPKLSVACEVKSLERCHAYAKAKQITESESNPTTPNNPTLQYSITPVLQSPYSQQVSARAST